LVALLTSFGVVVIGVLPGILVGVVLSLLKVLSQVVRPQDALLGRLPGTQALHDLGDDEAAQIIPGVVEYRFYGPLVFANVRFFIERLEHFTSWLSCGPPCPVETPKPSGFAKEREVELCGCCLDSEHS
jgi:SulP family sulfate permease